MSFFEQLDRQHRQPEPIRPEPMAVGQECPSPKCRGHMRVKFCADCEAQAVSTCICPFLRLICDGCGWAEEKRS